jgi:hypothetical protein
MVTMKFMLLINCFHLNSYSIMNNMIIKLLWHALIKRISLRSFFATIILKSEYVKKIET